MRASWLSGRQAALARELELSPHTVKRHVAHILDKRDLASSQAAWYHARAAV